MKKILILILILVFHINGISQILDVPYRHDFTIGNGCWANTAQMIIVYYGDDVSACELIEERRKLDPTTYGTTDCCVDASLCGGSGFVCGTTAESTRGLMMLYDIDSECVGVLSKAEVNATLRDNKPFAARMSGHIMVVYGYKNDNLYCHNTGNGTEILDYDDFVAGIGFPLAWIGSLVPDDGAVNCPLYQDIPGTLKDTPADEPFIYKATQDITISCKVEDDVDAHFLAGNDIVIESGFIIEAGGSIELQPGSTIGCP